MNPSTLMDRLKNKHMTIDEALSAPTTRVYNSITDPISGETHSLNEWSSILNIPYSSLCRRIKAGWTIDKVLHGERNSVNTPDPKYYLRKYDHMDLTGKTFGMLKVLKRADKPYIYKLADGTIKRESKWVCECKCKNIVEVIQHNLTTGRTTNCGCSNRNKLIDMTGKHFGHIKVLGLVDKKTTGENLPGGAIWLCQCECGNVVKLRGATIRANKDTISCGCKRFTVDGLSGTRIYTIYNDLIRRCTDIDDPAYKWYGGRGIYVCDEWTKGDHPFRNFYTWAFANGYSDNLTIDRRDNNGPYAPWNCRWVTIKVQANNRSNNYYITLDGITKTATEWSEISGINPYAIIRRCNRGWDIATAIFTPTMKVFKTTYGEEHTLSEWEAVTRIAKETIAARIREYNYSVNCAVYMPLNNFKAIPFAREMYEQQGKLMEAISFNDILSNQYTQKEWEAHQAVYFD